MGFAAHFAQWMSPLLEQRPLRDWRYWVRLQVLLAWSDEVDYRNDALHKALSAFTWTTPSPALEWKQNFSLIIAWKSTLFSNLFSTAVHTTFLSETQALILLSTTASECRSTHFITLVLLQCVHGLSDRGWWKECSIVRSLRYQSIRLRMFVSAPVFYQCFWSILQSFLRANEFDMSPNRFNDRMSSHSSCRKDPVDLSKGWLDKGGFNHSKYTMTCWNDIVDNGKSVHR